MTPTKRATGRPTARFTPTLGTKGPNQVSFSALYSAMAAVAALLANIGVRRPVMHDRPPGSGRCMSPAMTQEERLPSMVGSVTMYRDTHLIVYDGKPTILPCTGSDASSRAGLV